MIFKTIAIKQGRTVIHGRYAMNEVVLAYCLGGLQAAAQGGWAVKQQQASGVGETARSPRRLGQLGFPVQSSTDETTLQRENLRGLPRICMSLQLSAEKLVCEKLPKAKKRAL